VVGNGGGVGVLAADAAQAAGLELPGLSGDTRRRLAEAVPEAAKADNPIDLAAAAPPEAFAEALACLGASREVDVLLAVVAESGAGNVEANLNAIAQALDDLQGTPAAVVVVGSTDPPTALGARQIPVFDFPETAVAALGRAAAYAQWRIRPLGKRPHLQGIDRYKARAIVERLLEDGNEWHTASEAATILDCYGIPLAPTTTVTSKSRAVAAARALGYPVAVKADAPGLAHKTEVGAVRLDVRGPREVRAAFKQVAATVKGDKRAAVVLQPMLETDLELAAGIVHDPRFGSLVMLGLGGTTTEILGDEQYRVLPLTDTDAEAMWRSLKGARLLTGYRGSRPVDLDALTDLLARLGRLAEDLPEIAELDLNPLLNTRNGLQAVDVRLRLAHIGDEPDPIARRLR
jgi:acyl-CoA synthetase (NDP forming)